MWWRGLITAICVAVAILGLSCGGATTSSHDDICACAPSSPDSADYRHDAKHVPIPDLPPQEIDVTTILSWKIPPTPANDAPRTGRELQVFHIARAFARDVRVVADDCDLHIEISQTADLNAPRVIVETPIDSEYCPARRSLHDALQQSGFAVSNTQGGELPQPTPVEVTGLAFLDKPHNRGSALVATTWELHPAIVNLVP